ncbi:MAG: PAS domain S-box protein [Rhodocyclaceae bacterium]|nr:PAS domain S-box protein [Rhodocyclaceae bacterium]
MNLDRYMEDCSQLHAAGAGRVWLCRLLRPTLGKKFFLVFGLLAATGMANWLAVEATLSKLQGMAALVNVTGSLRWLSQNIQLDAMRIERNLLRERAAVDAKLARLEAAITALEDGGVAQGIAVGGLPASLGMDIAAVRLANDKLRRHAWLVLTGLDGGRDVHKHLDAMYLEGSNILGIADGIAAALTHEAQAAEARFKDILLRLGLLDLTLLVVVLLVLRLRVVMPLRQLAAASRGFAEGQRGLRSGFRSLDEIGQVAYAFDSMADTIERDMLQLAAGRAALEQKQQELRKFSLAIEHGPVSVVITDAQGVIEYVNPKFSEISGYAPEDVLGRKPSILKSGLMSEEVYAGMWRQLRAGREWHGELLNRNKNGELLWEDTSIAPLKDEAGRITHFVAVKEDITGRKQSEAEIADYNAELERRVAARTRALAESNRELESFSYSISHDLRAPLRALNGFAGLMAENCQGCAKSESLEYMARIQRASLRMGALMDDILDLSRVVRSEIKVGQVDLSAMVRSVLDDLRVAWPTRNVLAEVEEGLQANGDATLLQAVMENLLGNAWKFTAQRDPARIDFGVIENGARPAAGPPQGGAAIDMERSEPSSPPSTGRGEGERCFFVRDNGAGFDMQYAGKLFGAFQRLHGPQEFEGNGIGLAMVRRIVGLHGGRVWAEGKPGEGATFFFTLGNLKVRGGADRA